MEVKQESFDTDKKFIKIEPDLVCGQSEENDSRKQIMCVSSDPGNLTKVEIKQEAVDCDVTRIAHCSNFPIKMDHDSVDENVHFIDKTIISDLDGIQEVRATDMFVDINNIKQEVCEYEQVKTKSELLTTDCDLPTLKTESTDYPDYFVQPPTSTHSRSILKTLKNTAIDFKKKKRMMYTCPVCQKNFPSSKSRSKHIDGHFGKRFVVCVFCGKLMTKNEFIRHYFIHLVNIPAKKVCQTIKEDIFKIDTNINKVEVELLNSDICFQKWRLTDHNLVDANKKPFECVICCKSFRTSNIRNIHYLKVHSKEKPKCDICSKVFIRNGHLKRHLKIHANEKPFVCEICNKAFRENPDLRQHLLIHTNEKSFECAFCAKRFNQKRYLQVHLITHIEQQVFNCEFCSKTYNSERGMKRHLQLSHTNEQPHECEICLRKLQTKNSLQRHLKTHSSETPFKCEICSRTFNQKSILQRHLIIHSDEKPFKCESCLKEFRRKSDLKKHLKIHNIEKPFKSPKM